MNRVLKYILLVVFLMTLGYFLMDFFVRASFYQIDTRGIRILSVKMSIQFFEKLIFPISIGLIPILYLVINKFVKLKKSNGVKAIGIIVFCGLLFWKLRIIQLNNEFKRISMYSFDDPIIEWYSYGNLKFQAYLLFGFILGTLISILIFKSLRQKETR